jgi:DNA polymerase I-like protein with 3'-5' exonuclease and polymerase domains
VGRPALDVLLNIHDALLFQFDEEARVHYNRCLEIMCEFGPDDEITLDIPIEIDDGEGKTWAEATFGPEKKQ